MSNLRIFETLIAKAQEWTGAESFEQVMVHNPTQLYWGDGQ